MSILGYRISTRLVAGIATVLVFGTLAAVVAQTPEREIVLVARGMAFYRLGDPVTPNPVIRLRAGERVRVVLRNEDRGFTHDFAVPAFDAALDQINWNEDDEVVFSAPTTPGRYEYVCRPHMLMMRGQIVVEE